MTIKEGEGAGTSRASMGAAVLGGNDVPAGSLLHPINSKPLVEGAAKATAEIASTEAGAKSTLGVVSSDPLPLLLPEFSASTLSRIQTLGRLTLEGGPSTVGIENFKGGPEAFKRALQLRRMRRARRERGEARLAVGQTPPKSSLDRIRTLISKVQAFKAAEREARETKQPQRPAGIDPRVLTRHQVDAIIVYFTARQPDITVGAIADLLERTPKEIRSKRQRLIREDAAVLIPDLNTQNVFADLVFVKQTAQEMALAEKDYEAYWDIEREYREELVNLGFIEQIPKRVEIRDLRMTLNEQMAEFMHEFGTPNPRELIARLRGFLPAAGGAPSTAAPGNGNGNGDGGRNPEILVVPVCPVDPAGSPREPKTDGSENQG